MAIGGTRASERQSAAWSGAHDSVSVRWGLSLELERPAGQTCVLTAWAANVRSADMCSAHDLAGESRSVRLGGPDETDPGRSPLVGSGCPSPKGRGPAVEECRGASTASAGLSPASDIRRGEPGRRPLHYWEEGPVGSASNADRGAPRGPRIGALFTLSSRSRDQRPGSAAGATVSLVTNWADDRHRRARQAIDRGCLRACLRWLRPNRPWQTPSRRRADHASERGAHQGVVRATSSVRWRSKGEACRYSHGRPNHR